MISNLLTKKERAFFNVAKSVSHTSDYVGTSVGCVVVYKNAIVSVASNSEKTHTLQKFYDRFRNFDVEHAENKLHAEVHALSLAKNVIFHTNISLSDISIFVYRELKNGQPAISKPCSGCFSLIKDLGIRYMFYIDEHGNFVKEKIN